MINSQGNYTIHLKIYSQSQTNSKTLKNKLNITQENFQLDNTVQKSIEH